MRYSRMGVRYHRPLAYFCCCGLRRQRPLSPREVAALPVLARGAARRFLLMRLQAGSIAIRACSCVPRIRANSQAGTDIRYRHCRRN